MAKTPYKPPQIDLSEVKVLIPAHKQKVELTPDTPVICLNRGPHVLRDTFDAEPYEIPPGKFQVAYAAAKHFQNRLIVPGTRNPRPDDPSLPQSVSWISILGVDPPKACEPFSDAFLALVGEQKEGLNRAALPPGDRDVVIAQTSALRATIPGQGEASLAVMAAAESGYDGASEMSGGGRGVVHSIEGSDAAVAKALEPVQGSDASAAVAHGLASGWVPPTEGELSVQSAPAPERVAAAVTGRKKR